MVSQQQSSAHVIEDFELDTATLGIYYRVARQHRQKHSSRATAAKQQRVIPADHVCSEAEIKEAWEMLRAWAIYSGERGHAGAEDITQECFKVTLEDQWRRQAEGQPPIRCICAWASHKYEWMLRRRDRDETKQRRRAEAVAATYAYDPGTGEILAESVPAEQQLYVEVQVWREQRLLMIFMDAVHMIQATSKRLYTKEAIEEIFSGEQGTMPRQRRSQELEALRKDLTTMLQNHLQWEELQLFAQSLQKHADK